MGSVETESGHLFRIETEALVLRPFELGDAAQLPFNDGTFDAVMSSQVFEYLEGGFSKTGGCASVVAGDLHAHV